MTTGMNLAAHWHELAVTQLDAGRLDEAERCCRAVLEIEPRHAKALANLGAVLQRTGRAEEAARSYRAALEVDPRLAQAWFNLGTLFLAAQQPAAAIEPLQRAVGLEPGQAPWHGALGSAFSAAHRPLDAKASLERALELDPMLAPAHEVLAGCLLDMGDADAAVRLFRRAHELGVESAGSNALMALNYAAGREPEAIFREHVAWAGRLDRVPGRLKSPNVPDAERKLRVGYLSPDFRSHAMAYFVEAVFARHDPSRIALACYSDAAVEDAVTARLRALAHEWHPIAGLDDAAVARQIRADRIDILVDLAGHSAGGRRMRLLAGRPAPVQASWLGYLNTTGLAAMDYRITDRHACPEEWQRLHTERLVRMPDSQWCYAPDPRAPEPGPLPALRTGAVTFGSFHNFAKVAPVVGLWSRVLKAVPRSRLLMLAAGMEQLFPALARQFEGLGVERGRIEVRGRVSIEEYFALHHQVDINLDAFPYTGGTTTCHSLWMGVPVVTLCGDSVVSRGGASVLSAAGMPQWIAQSEAEYIGIATRLAGDLQQLAGLRRSLRGHVARTPLTDAVRFTQALEEAYRAMWRSWCATHADLG
jgi:predicted O-linked N-acetylglucosamine transferase (SPINDLY family)